MFEQAPSTKTWHERLVKHLDTPVHVWVEDVTDGHAQQGFEDGRALAADGQELCVLAVTDQFKGKTPVERHQIVHDCFVAELESGAIHSIRIRAWTEKQWTKKGSPHSWPSSQNTRQHQAGQQRNESHL